MRDIIFVESSNKTLTDALGLTETEFEALDHYEAVPTKLENNKIGFKVNLYYKN